MYSHETYSLYRHRNRPCAHSMHNQQRNQNNAFVIVPSPDRECSPVEEVPPLLKALLAQPYANRSRASVPLGTRDPEAQHRATLLVSVSEAADHKPRLARPRQCRDMSSFTSGSHVRVDTYDDHWQYAWNGQDHEHTPAGSMRN